MFAALLQACCDLKGWIGPYHPIRYRTSTSIVHVPQGDLNRWPRQTARRREPRIVLITEHTSRVPAISPQSCWVSTAIRRRACNLTHTRPGSHRIASSTSSAAALLEAGWPGRRRGSSEPPGRAHRGGTRSTRSPARGTRSTPPGRCGWVPRAGTTALMDEQANERPSESTIAGTTATCRESAKMHPNAGVA
jgi:hypothetical protein